MGKVLLCLALLLGLLGAQQAASSLSFRTGSLLFSGNETIQVGKFAAVSRPMVLLAIGRLQYSTHFAMCLNKSLGDVNNGTQLLTVNLTIKERGNVTLVYILRVEYIVSTKLQNMEAFYINLTTSAPQSNVTTTVVKHSKTIRYVMYVLGFSNNEYASEPFVKENYGTKGVANYTVVNSKRGMEDGEWVQLLFVVFDPMACRNSTALVQYKTQISSTKTISPVRQDFPILIGLSTLNSASSGSFSVDLEGSSILVGPKSNFTYSLMQTSFDCYENDTDALLAKYAGNPENAFERPALLTKQEAEMILTLQAQDEQPVPTNSTKFAGRKSGNVTSSVVESKTINGMGIKTSANPKGKEAAVVAKVDNSVDASAAVETNDTRTAANLSVNAASDLLANDTTNGDEGGSSSSASKLTTEVLSVNRTSVDSNGNVISFDNQTSISAVNTDAINTLSADAGLVQKDEISRTETITPIIQPILGSTTTSVSETVSSPSNSSSSGSNSSHSDASSSNASSSNDRSSSGTNSSSSNASSNSSGSSGSSSSSSSKSEKRRDDYDEGSEDRDGRHHHHHHDRAGWAFFIVFCVFLGVIVIWAAYECYRDYRNKRNQRRQNQHPPAAPPATEEQLPGVIISENQPPVAIIHVERQEVLELSGDRENVRDDLQSQSRLRDRIPNHHL